MAVGNSQIRVLVVDDSALVRAVLTAIIDSDNRFCVVGAAADPYEARDKIKVSHPDVLTLDVEMPRMNGLVFLKNLMRLHPMPVVMVSSLTQRGADVTLDALSLGAIDFVAKPRVESAQAIEDYREEILEKLAAAAAVNVFSRRRNRGATRVSTDAILAACPSDRIIAIGASTGGTEAICDVLREFPCDAPAAVVTQHIPVLFSARFAERLDRECAIHVCEATDGQLLMEGHAYVAPGDRHLTIIRGREGYRCRLDSSEAVNRHRPSVDVMFRSVAEAAGSMAVAALLTGMGADGAEGLKELRECGARTIAQDEATSVVWGMPGSAHRIGAAEDLVSLKDIAGVLLRRSAALKGGLGTPQRV